MHGVVLDAFNPAGRPTMRQLSVLNSTLVRLTAKPSPIRKLTDYAKSLTKANINYALVLARESFPDDRYRDWTAYYAQYLNPWLWVIGNEPDAYLLPEPSPSSWSMQPEEYQQLFNQCASVLQDKQLCIGGQVSGQTTWLEQIKGIALNRIRIDIHPYIKDAEEARALIESLTYIHDQVPVVLEWTRPIEQVVEYVQMLDAWTEASTYFCWSDGMVPGFGLVDRPDFWVLKGALM